MNRILKESTHPTFPLEKLLQKILEIEERESRSAMRLENLYNAGSHLVAAQRSSSLSQKLSGVGFGSSSSISTIISEFSRWSLSYTLEQISKSLGFVVKNSNMEAIQGGRNEGCNICKVCVCRAENYESTTRVVFLLTAESKIEGAECECLGPQQIRLACRHIYSAHAYITAASLSVEGERLNINCDRAELFRLVADHRWRWTGEPELGEVCYRDAGEVRVLHRSLPIDDLYTSSTLVSARSEEASTYRFNQLMILGKHIATFASPLPETYKRVRFSLEEILKARMQLERVGRQEGRDQRTLNCLFKNAPSRISPTILKRKKQGGRSAEDSPSEASINGQPSGKEQEVHQVARTLTRPLARSRLNKTQRSCTNRPVQLQSTPNACSSLARTVRTREKNLSGSARHEKTPTMQVSQLREPKLSATRAETSEEHSVSVAEVLTPLPRQRQVTEPRVASAAPPPRNPPHRQGKGPLRNIHGMKNRRKKKEFGAPLRVRNAQNQDVSCAFNTDETKELMRKFFSLAELTQYGPKNEYMFETTDERWPCLVKLLGGSCPSVRGSKLCAAFKGLKGVQRHMRTAHKMELIDYARQVVKENRATFDVAEEDEWGSQEVQNDGLEDEQSSIALNSEDEARMRRKRKKKREHEKKKRQRMLQDKDLSSSERAARFNLGFYSDSSTKSFLKGAIDSLAAGASAAQASSSARKSGEKASSVPQH